ncbi:hypothetical protein [Cellulomonas pakistanensis]|uniref:Uncharacterized protein n=1 Tax=Cellulomonas pakistanensis TaxID=992287 RepID=A0A919PC73_9CELL|nr:hypothetical protein [Cellulomonas pakistanensis]GIG36991.1 hypothetical protein Cpa01nite_23720 [Cellulomonas pakistanensis]
MSRARTAALLAVPLAAAAVALTLYAGPYWVGEVRHRVDEQRWPEQRARIEAALAAVELPAGYAPLDCADSPFGAPESGRCWRTTTLPADAAGDLAPALTAVGVEIEESLTGIGPVLHGTPASAAAVGTLEGRSVHLSVTREVDRTRLPATPFGDTAVVELTADLGAP